MELKNWRERDGRKKKTERVREMKERDIISVERQMSERNGEGETEKHERERESREKIEERERDIKGRIGE